MKTLKFKNLSFENTVTLSKKEQTKIIGGYGSIPQGATYCQYTCSSILGGSRNLIGSTSADPCSWYEATSIGHCW